MVTCTVLSDWHSTRITFSYKQVFSQGRVQFEILINVAFTFVPLIAALETCVITTEDAERLSFTATTRALQYLIAVSGRAPLQLFVLSHDDILRDCIVHLHLLFCDKRSYIIWFIRQSTAFLHA